MTQEEYNKAMKQRASGGYANTSINKVPYATSTDLINIDRRVVQSQGDGMNYKELGGVLRKHNFENLLIEYNKKSFHIHDKTIEDILTSDPDEIFYICHH